MLYSVRIFAILITDLWIVRVSGWGDCNLDGHATCGEVVLELELNLFNFSFVLVDGSTHERFVCHVSIYLSVSMLIGYLIHLNVAL